MLTQQTTPSAAPGSGKKEAVGVSEGELEGEGEELIEVGDGVVVGEVV